MPDRKGLVTTLWLTLSLALLAAVLAVPIRAVGFVSISSRTDGLLRRFVLPPVHSTPLLSAGIATDSDPKVKALLSEDEEQERTDALVELRVSFQIPCTVRKVSDRQVVAPRSILSLYHLRC